MAPLSHDTGRSSPDGGRIRTREFRSHFERVTASVTLDHMDRHPVEASISGLARSKAEIEKLQRI